MKIKEIFVITISILLHEIGHVLFSCIFGVKNFQFEISMFGSICKMDLNSLSKFKKLIIYSGGIIFNILLILLFKYNKSRLYSDIIIHYNVLMLIVSCLPIYPLDGYNILTVLSNKNIELISSIALFLLIIGILITKSYGLIFIMCFLLYKQKEKNKIKEYNYLKNITNYALLNRIIVL